MKAGSGYVTKGIGKACIRLKFCLGGRLTIESLIDIPWFDFETRAISDNGDIEVMTFGQVIIWALLILRLSHVDISEDSFNVERMT